MTTRSVHRANRSRPSTSRPAASRLAASRLATDDTLGIDRIGRGFDIVACVFILYQLSVFLVQFADNPVPLPGVAAWALLLISLAVTPLARWRFGEDLPVWIFGAIMGSWVVVVALDLAGGWHRPELMPTAAVAVGAGLLFFVTLQRARLVIIAAGTLALLFIVSFCLNGVTDVLAVGPGIVTLALTIMPAILGVGLVGAIRTVAGFERGLAQAQSTVNAPRFAIGLMASEELARLDLDAEQLLDNVGIGRIPLPLDPETAAGAASLATELRLHLIEGRRETWLYHAVSESAFLGPQVTVTDPDGLAGMLNPSQRDGLLTAAWLLVSDPVRKGQAHDQDLRITLQREPGQPVRDAEHRIWIRITIVTTSVPRTGVDPAAWQAIRKVGRFVESSTGYAMRIEIECAVDNPAD